MDIWKYFDITHRHHVVCNPTNLEKLSQLINILHLKSDSHVLEMASGKGEFMVRLAEKYGISGVGVDLSPFCIADATRKHQERAPEAQLRFVEMDGVEFEPEEGESFDVLACIGASWIFGGHVNTLEALNRMAASRSWIVVGEPYWMKEPTPAHLEAINSDIDTYGTHYENVMAGERLGLKLVYTLVSSLDDWDKYEGLQWYAAEEWALENPDDPDVEEVLRRTRKSKEIYLRWGRDAFGWAIYMFRKGAVK